MSSGTRGPDAVEVAAIVNERRRLLTAAEAGVAFGSTAATASAAAVHARQMWRDGRAPAPVGEPDGPLLGRELIESGRAARQHRWAPGDVAAFLAGGWTPRPLRPTLRAVEVAS